MDTGIQARRLSEAIRNAREDRYIKAVVLRVDSPGGKPLASELVARELRETMESKPVIVSQGNVAASGGYWIGMHSHAILASPFTLTGSIGVIGGWIYDDGFGEKIGFDYSEVHRGAHGDLGGGIRLPFAMTLPARPLDDEEKARVETVIRRMYDDFVEGVAEGRGMSPAAVDRVGQGRVWSGEAGLENGLVDQLGGLWRAIQLAKDRAGIPGDEAVRIVEAPQLGLFDLRTLRPRFGPEIGNPSALDPLGGGPRELLGPWMGLSEEELRYMRDVFGNPGRPMLRTPPAEILDGSEPR
jgi:protease-4